jgi:hypothetical protein
MMRMIGLLRVVWISAVVLAFQVQSGAEALMADDTPGPNPTSPEPPQPGTAATPSGPEPVTEPANADQSTISIGDEFGTAKRNLPPARIVGIGLALVLVVALIVIFTQSRPTSHGSIDDITTVEIPDQGATMVSLNVTVQNGGEKPLWINAIKATIKTDKGEFSDDAASPIDFGRYYQAFPALKEHALNPLAVETKIAPGAEAKGTILVSFPVTPDAFNARKELMVTIQPYDQRAVVLKK